MSFKVNVADFKRRFSELLDRVSRDGEAVVITRRGRAEAVLVSLDQTTLAALADREPTGPRLGLLGAVGAWEDYPDIDGFIEVIRERRSRAPDRPVPKAPSAGD